jgi:hypothetical protein
MANPLKWLIFTALLSFCTSIVHAQTDTTYNPNHLYQPQALHADLAFLKSVLQEAHPSLYRYTTKDSLDACFAAADAQLNRPMTEIDFWLIATRYVAAIRSGHTVIAPSSRDVKWHNKHPLARLPLNVYISNNRLFAAQTPSQADGLFNGAEIIAIDGHSAVDVLNALRPLISPEGHSMQFVNYELEGIYFRQLYGYMFGFKPKYDVTYKDSVGAIKHAELDAMKAAYSNSIDKQNTPSQQEKEALEKAVEVNYFNNVPFTAELKIKRLNYLNDFIKFDYGFFKKLHDDHTKNLIIDMRGNGGGFFEIDLDMMHYLVQNFYLPDDAITTPTNSYSFKQYIVHPGSDSIRANHLVKNSKGGYSLITDYHEKTFTAPYVFNKKVYVLIDKGTFSAASYFVAALKAQRDITVIGEETGGGEAGTDCRFFSIVRLPNTRLLLRLPQFWMTAGDVNKNTGHGVMPDVAVVPSIASRVNNRDVVLETALQMIMNQQQ